MTANEKKLLETIRNHPEPEQAVEIAIKTILAFSEQDESSQDIGLTITGIYKVGIPCRESTFGIGIYVMGTTLNPWVLIRLIEYSRPMASGEVIVSSSKVSSRS